MLSVVLKWVESRINYEELYGRPGNILSYGSTFLTTIGWLIPRRGSIFSFRQQLVISGAFVILCTVIAFSSCDNSKHDLCFNMMPPSSSNLTLMTLCSFVVAFFMGIVVQRWWSIRLHIQGVIGGSLNVMMLLMGILSMNIIYSEPDKVVTAQEEVDKIARTISGQLVLCLRLLFNKGRHNNRIHDLVQKGLISTEDEKFFVAPNDNPLYPLCEVVTLLQEARHNGYLGKDQYQSTTNLEQLVDLVSAIRQNASFIIVYITTQLPYPFIQIVSAVVYAFLAQLVFVCASYISTGIHQQRDHNDNNTFAGHGYLTVILYSFVLLGMLKLFQHLSNPLGSSAADFPGDAYQKDLESTLARIITNAYAEVSQRGPASRSDAEKRNCKNASNRYQGESTSENKEFEVV